MQRTDMREIEEMQARYYAADAGTEQVLEALLERVGGLVRGRIAGHGIIGDDLDDLCAETISRLVRGIRSGIETSPDRRIKNLTAYAVTAADHVFDDHLRRSRPNWYRLKRKIVYLLDGKGGGHLFARWKLRADWIGGFGRWRGKSPALTARYQVFQEDTAPFCEEVLRRRNPEQVPLPELLALLFRWIDTPLETDRLTSHLAEMQQIREPTVTALEDGAGNSRGEMAVRHMSELDTVSAYVLNEIAGETLREQIWQDLCGLPLRQRTALLLGLTREELLLLALATPIADALALSVEEFRRLWPLLPLNDSAIALRLNATPKQVSNLRKCARERIWRRLKNEPGTKVLLRED